MPTAFPDDVLRRIRDLEQRAGQQLTPPASVPFFVGTPTDAQILVYEETSQTWRAVSLSGGVTITDEGVATLATGDTYQDHGNAGTTETVDFATAAVHRLVLNDDCTLTLSGATSGKACGLTLYLVQDATGGETVTWPGSVNWPFGTAPTLSTAPDAIDIVVLETFDGGTSWFANLAGKAYA